MIRNDVEWLALLDEFHGAAIDGARWYPALEALAAATGSRSGQLIGIGAGATLPFNIVTNLEVEGLREFENLGGADPKVNPRVKAGMQAPVLKVMTNADFLTAEEQKRNPEYCDFVARWDIPFSCLTPLERQGDLLVGLSVLRSKREGHITDEQRRIFASVAPHVRAAVRTQIALESHGAALLAGCMESLSVPAFVCDSAGRVRALTLSAEALIRENRGLTMKSGRLLASQASDTSALSVAIAAAASGHHPGASAANLTVVVRGLEHDSQPLVLDITPMPSLQYEFNLTPRVIVLVRGTRDAGERRAAILQAAYGLTAAETEVALQLSRGRTPEAVSSARGVTIGTVRAQIKSLLAKVGTNRLAELVARLNQF